MNRRVKVSIAVLALILASAIMLVSPKLRAQVSSIVGYIQPTNYLAPTSGQMGLVGGVLSNPSGLVAQVSAGSAFCQGSEEEVPQVQLTLLANTTYLIVFNCTTQQVYAKTAVTGPGSPSTSSGTFTNSPGLPNSVLFAAYPEIPINTAVAGASSVSFTDARVPAQWSAGTPTGAHLLTSSTNGDTFGIKAASSGTMSYTFQVPYVSAPVCVASDQTTADALKVAVTATTLTVTGATTTDSIAYACGGNPY